MAGSASGELLGTVIGPWRVVRFLGAGTMGAVYLVEHLKLRSRAAAKFLHAHLVTDDAAMSRFQGEALAASGLAHPNVVSVFDVGALPSGQPWFVMEFLEGRTLESELATEDFPLWRVAQVVTQIASALERAHERGVVHRDLKPANVMLLKLGREDFVKVVDFGIAKVRDASLTRQTATGAVLGTPDYMSPEQISGAEVDGRADVYALGAIAWELLVGRAPFWRHNIAAVLMAHLEELPDSPTSHRPSVPVAVSVAVLKALAKHPAERFQSALAFAEALQNAVSSYGPSRATPLPVASPIAPKKRRREAMLVIGTQRHQVWSAHETSVGCFVETTADAPMLSDVEMLIGEAGAVRARVVRRVSAEDAVQWRHAQGLFVEFFDLSPRQRVLLDGAAHPDEIVAEEFLERLRARLWGDAYCVLGLAPSADVTTVRETSSRLLAELGGFTTRQISEQRSKELNAARVRVIQCTELLCDVDQRALWDADRANWRGVAACMAAGLPVERVKMQRAEWLRQNPLAELRGKQLLEESRAQLVKSSLSDAIEQVQRALESDPLNVTMHELRNAMLTASGLPLPTTRDEAQRTARP